MKLNRLLIAILLLLFSCKILAQEIYISGDSLNTLTQKAYKFQREYKIKNAIETGESIVAIAERQKDYYYAYIGHNILGYVYYLSKDSTHTRLSYEKALEAAKRTKTDSVLAWAYINLGNIESDRGVNYQRGIEYFKQSIRLNQNIGLEKYNIVPNFNIGWTYLNQESEDKGYPFLLEAQKLLQRHDPSNERLKSGILVTLGKYHLAKGDLELARSHFEDATTAAENVHYVPRLVEIFSAYAQLEEDAGNYELALGLMHKGQEYEQQMFEEEKKKAADVAGARTELENYKHNLEDARKEKEISDKLVEKSKLLNYILWFATIILFAALIGIFLALKTRNKFIYKLHKKNNQLEEAKTEAERLSKLKTQFFSTVSHELRTPLYGVVGISSFLLEENTNPKLEEDLKSLKFSGDYLLALINDVLLINKMDADRIEAQRLPFKLSDLIKNIVRSFEFSLEQNNNKIHLNVDPRLPNNLIGDSIRISQVLMNLIGNAIKFNENGNIWVDIDLVELVSVHKHIAKFTIKDDGIGIPESKQESIFEEFSQVHNKNYNYQGTGLGLPIVKKLLTLLGSEISLTSKLEEGSIFTFCLELESDSSVELKKTKADIETEGLLATFASNAMTSSKVLIVDDNRINQKITQKILEKNNFECEMAYDGIQAVELAQKNVYDVILMDINMPKLGGIPTTKLIREFDTVTPIIALTAVEIDELRTEILNSGMNDIILKPYDSSQFISTILKNANSARKSLDNITNPQNPEAQSR